LISDEAVSLPIARHGRVCGGMIHKQARGDQMPEKTLNVEELERKREAYELYAKHGFQNGYDFVAWLEAELQVGKRDGLRRNKEAIKILPAIVGTACLIAVISFTMPFRKSSKTNLFLKCRPESKVMMFVLDLKDDGNLYVLGATPFGFDPFTLAPEAKKDINADVRIVQKGRKPNLRLAGWCSTQGMKDVHPDARHKRIDRAGSYLVEKGIGREETTTTGHGGSKPPVSEENPDLSGFLFMAVVRAIPSGSIESRQRMPWFANTRLPLFMGKHSSDENRIRKVKSVIPERTMPHMKQRQSVFLHPVFGGRSLPAGNDREGCIKEPVSFNLIGRLFFVDGVRQSFLKCN
jgi:hypothetical protein